MGIDIAQRVVPEGPGQRAHDRKAQVLPQPHGGHIAGHHQVELHGPKAHGHSLLLRVLGHQRRHTLPLRSR